VPLSSKTLAQAAQIAEHIESLENQLSVLLQGGDSIEKKQITAKSSNETQNRFTKKGRICSS
jgi:hypothetical protein